MVDWGDSLFDPIKNMSDNPNALVLLEQTKIDPEAYSMIAMLRQQIGDQTFNASSSGRRQGDSGTQEAILMGQDMKKMRVPRTQLETGKNHGPI
jgi:hypothetical protein